MSLAVLGRNTFRQMHQAPSFYRNGMQCRFTHHSPSYDYLRIWRDHKVDYLEKMHHSFSPNRADGLDPGENMCGSPQLLDRILRVEAVMKLHGLVPFVHAMPAGSKVTRRFSEILYQAKSESKNQFFTYLRTPGEPFMISWEKAISQIPTETEKSQKPHLLSLSYALTSGIKPLESAASWGFINHFGNTQNFSNRRNFEALMRSQGFKDQPEAMNYFVKRAWRLIRQYGRLKVGNFLVIGVPEKKLSRFIYDSKPYNARTDRDVRSVVTEPHKHIDSLMREETHMATLLLCEETLDPQSGLLIVDANDERQVDDFCANRDLEPMNTVELYKEMLRPHESEFERVQTEKRKKIDEELELLIEEFTEVRINPKKPIDSESFDEDFTSSDIPESAF